MRHLQQAVIWVAAALVLAWAAPAPADGPESVLILYDSSGSWAWLGEVYSKQLANLLGHFELDYEVTPVEQYAPGAIDSHLATFYIGSICDNPLPEIFRQEVVASEAPICWLKYNLWQVAWDQSGVPDPAFEAKFGFRFVGLDSSGYREVLYHNETFTKSQQDPELGLVSILDPGRCIEMATAAAPTLDAAQVFRAVGPAAGFDGGARRSGPPPATIPYVVRGGNLWYVADVPFSYVSEEDRYIVFADLLHDILGIDHAPSHRALIRIEDVDPTFPPALLRQIADYLYSEGVPFSVSVIPVYADPFGVYNGGVAQWVEMSQSPEFLEALRYMTQRGGTLIWHGYTHQYDSVENPYNGVTADDFEFYRTALDAHDEVIYLEPVAEDSLAWAQGRINGARQQAASALLHFAAWETPHYTASALDYGVFAANFALTVGRATYFAESEPLYFGGQFFPYVIYGDVYGQKVVPENVGCVDPYGWGEYGPWLPEDIVRAAAKNLAVRDGWASAYFHPFLDLGYLQEVVRGLRALGYRFVSLRDMWDDNFPVADAGVPAPQAAEPGQPVAFDASGSYHPGAGRSIVLYQWDWESDGVYDATGVSASHAYAQPGDYLVTLRVTDDSPRANAATDSVVVHVALPPVITNFSINGGAEMTASRAVMLSIAAAGATQTRCRNQGGAWSAWRSHAAQASWTLSGGGEGWRTVEVQCRNAYGMVSEVASDTIFFDDAASAPRGTVTIAEGATYTARLDVLLTLAATGAAEMRLKNRYADPWGEWQPWASSKQWRLAEGGEGWRAAYVQYRDLHGNESAVRNDTIFYDTAQPPTGAIRINDGAPVTLTREVTVNVSARGAAQMRLKHRYADPWGAWQPAASSIPWTLLEGPDGTRPVYAQLRDYLGNLSATYCDTIFYDTAAPPDLRYFRIEFDAATTPSREVTLCLSALGATEMRFKNRYADPWGAWMPYSTRAAWRLADGPDGPRAVYCQCRDSLGNLSGVRSDTIILERP